jgi:DNA repair exonuclease SbcCD ATPase subunit
MSTSLIKQSLEEIRQNERAKYPWTRKNAIMGIERSKKYTRLAKDLQKQNADIGSRYLKVCARENALKQEKAKFDQEKAEFAQKQAEFDQKQAEFDQKQAEFAQKQAEFDQKQAEFAQKQAEFGQAKVDFGQAKVDFAREKSTIAAKIDEQAKDIESLIKKLGEAYKALDNAVLINNCMQIQLQKQDVLDKRSLMLEDMTDTLEAREFEINIAAEALANDRASFNEMVAKVNHEKLTLAHDIGQFNKNRADLYALIDKVNAGGREVEVQKAEVKKQLIELATRKQHCINRENDLFKEQSRFAEKEAKFNFEWKMFVDKEAILIDKQNKFNELISDFQQQRALFLQLESPSPDRDSQMSDHELDNAYAKINDLLALLQQANAALENEKKKSSNASNSATFDAPASAQDASLSNLSTNWLAKMKAQSNVSTSSNKGVFDVSKSFAKSPIDAAMEDLDDKE